MQLNKIPTTIVTGFLGSGKTTLLSNVLKQAAGKRIAVIVNEFGELDIDSDLLRSCPLDCPEGEESNQRSDDGFYELANGCICCTVEEESVAAGRFAHDENKVQAQREADESLDHDPSLQELLDDQLSAADLVVVTKNDLLDESARARVQAIISHEVPSTVKTVYIENGEAALDVLLGIDAATESRIDDVHNHHDHHHAHGEHHDHAHDHFDSFVVTLGEVQSDLLQETLSQLVEEHNIFRVKGFAAVHGKPMRQVFQVVGTRLDRYFDRLWQPEEIRKTQLVFIGKGITKEQIEGILHDALSA